MKLDAIMADLESLRRRVEQAEARSEGLADALACAIKASEILFGTVGYPDLDGDLAEVSDDAWALVVAWASLQVSAADGWELLGRSEGGECAEMLSGFLRTMGTMPGPGARDECRRRMGAVMKMDRKRKLLRLLNAPS